jgi:D-threo-aldose 1-dehydrogenase
MKYATLGQSGVRVSTLGFGGASIGNLYTRTDDDAARGAVDAAWEGGVRYFDTAPHYGLGLSERRLGNALTDRPRADFTVSTKVGRLLVHNPSPSGSDLQFGGFEVPDTMTRVRDYSRAGVLRSLESSLERLRLDHIDVVYVHDPEDHMDSALAGAVPALIEMREQHVIGAVGVGMNHVSPLLRFLAESDLDAIMLAGRWTLIDRSGEALVDACLEQGVSIVAAAPFNSGLLARRWPPDEAYFDYGPAPAHLLEKARAYATICEAHGVTLPHAAIQFPLNHPAVKCVVVGMRTREHAEANLRWSSEPVEGTLWARIGAAV